MCIIFVHEWYFCSLFLIPYVLCNLFLFFQGYNVVESQKHTKFQVSNMMHLLGLRTGPLLKKKSKPCHTAEC